MKQFYLIIGLVLLTINAFAVAQEKPPAFNIALFSLATSPEMSPYWHDVARFAQASADGLGINLTVVYNTSGHRTGYVDLIEAQLKSNNKPDAFLASSYRGISKKVIMLADKYRVPLIMINNSLPEQSLESIGAPREKFKYYIGHVKPNDFNFGYALANYLISQAEQLSSRKYIDIIGISGGKDAPEARARNNGLIKAATEHKNANLLQIVPTNWLGQTAYRKVASLNKRHPNLQIVWCASDHMAIHSIAALKAQHKTLLVGGMDWSAEAIASIKKGQLSATAGGQFTNAGYALILLFDYLSGNDFAQISPLTIVTQGGLIHRGNVDKYDKLLTDKPWSNIKFRQYSRTLSPHNTRYDFSLSRLIAQANMTNH